MRSTMMDFPLTIGHIFAHGRTLYADSEVVTCEADGARRRIQFGALADRAEQLAAALRRLGVEPGERVATFAWNNSEHQEAYFAIPGMGAVMHTISSRLSADAGPATPSGHPRTPCSSADGEPSRRLPRGRSLAAGTATRPPDERWGERPLACIARVPDRSVTPEELRAHLSGQVVKWWLPEQWAFVDDVPRTSVGKHDKKLLRERHAEGSLPVVTIDEPSAK